MQFCKLQSKLTPNFFILVLYNWWILLDNSCTWIAFILMCNKYFLFNIKFSSEMNGNVPSKSILCLNCRLYTFYWLPFFASSFMTFKQFIEVALTYHSYKWPFLCIHWVKQTPNQSHIRYYWPFFIILTNSYLKLLTFAPFSKCRYKCVSYKFRW